MPVSPVFSTSLASQSPNLRQEKQDHERTPHQVTCVETDEKSAKQLAERCRAALFKEQIPHENSAVSRLITVSMGIGTVIPGRDGKSSDFLETVDTRLYQAKNAGRNRFVEAA